MKIDSSTVRLVLAIVEEGSISRAADKVGLAIAAASRRVSDLEQQLGAKLFKRVPHGVEISENGEKLLVHIRQIDNLIDRLSSDAQALNAGLNGRIIIGAPKTVVIQFLASAIAGIQKAYPEISLKIVEENSKIVQQLLRDKVIDIGIYEKRSGFLDLEQFAYRTDELALVYSRQHFKLAPTALDIETFMDLPIICLGNGSAILGALQGAFHSQGRIFINNFAVSGFDTMLALVRNGLGVGLMPADIFKQFRPDDSLVCTAIAGDWHRRHYVLSCVDDRARAETLRQLACDLLRE